VRNCPSTRHHHLIINSATAVGRGARSCARSRLDIYAPFVAMQLTNWQLSTTADVFTNTLPDQSALTLPPAQHTYTHRPHVALTLPCRTHAAASSLTVVGEAVAERRVGDGEHELLGPRARQVRCDGAARGIVGCGRPRHADQRRLRHELRVRHRSVVTHAHARHKRGVQHGQRRRRHGGTGERRDSDGAAKDIDVLCRVAVCTPVTATASQRARLHGAAMENSATYERQLPCFERSSVER
jgi:hypothetical protein